MDNKEKCSGRIHPTLCAINRTATKNKKATITNSPKETRDLAAKFAGRLKGGEVIALTGPLGAGKTVFVKGLAKGLGIPERGVRSPSFVILIEHHQGRLPLFHFDFYRFEKGAEIDTTPFEDCLKSDGVIVVEWPERISGYLPPETRKVSIKVLGKKSRKISFCVDK